MQCPLCKSNNINALYKLKSYDVVRCSECELRFSWPLKKHNYEEEYFKKEQKPYFESNSEKEDSKNQIFVHWIKEIEKVKKNKGKILDVGCATGNFLRIAKKRGWDVYGLDISKYATDFVKKNIEAEVKTGELVEVNYKKNSFDVIFSSFMIEHTDNPLETIKEMNKILKREGVLFISTINENSFLNKVADLTYKFSLGIIKKPVKLLHPDQHIIHFSDKNLIDSLKNTGFKVIKLEKLDLPTNNFKGGIIKDIILKIFYFFQRIFGKQYIVWAIATKNC